MRAIRIGDITFTLKNKNQTTEYWQKKHLYDGVSDITEAYKYPSWRKQDIWDSWYDDLSKIGAYSIRAIRGNGFYFSIGAQINYEGTEYFIYITAGNNYIIKIN